MKTSSNTKHHVVHKNPLNKTTKYLQDVPKVTKFTNVVMLVLIFFISVNYYYWCINILWHSTCVIYSVLW